MLYHLYKTKGATGVEEPCLIKDDGNYIGIKTGKLYPRSEYYHRNQFKAKIIAVDNNNKTGMLHLYRDTSFHIEENAKSKKEKYLGCIVTVEEAHWNGDIRVYYCNELNEYFSDSEIQIIAE